MAIKNLKNRQSKGKARAKDAVEGTLMTHSDDASSDGKNHPQKLTQKHHSLLQFSRVVVIGECQLGLDNENGGQPNASVYPDQDDAKA